MPTTSPVPSAAKFRPVRRTLGPSPASLGAARFRRPDVSRLRVKIFADGADLAAMVALAAQPRIAGLTTNPTLMRKAGITDYRGFAREVIAAIPD